MLIGSGFLDKIRKILKLKINKIKHMSWCFAIVNNRLAEIYFDKKKNNEPVIWAHCYIKKEDFKTKEEQKWIKQDTEKVRVVYRNKKYKLISQ